MSEATIQEAVALAILEVLSAAQLGCELPPTLILDRPKNRDHGDYASSIALALAKPAGKNPRDIALIIQAGLAGHKDIESVDIAGPGFINITVAKSSQGAVIVQALTQGEKYGHGKVLVGTAINLEFISANPTGPLHLGHTRWAAVGDALGRVLSAAGARVEREFYINDRGVQMDKFGASLRAAALGESIPEDGYHGEYILDLAKAIVAKNPAVKSLNENEGIAAFRDLGYALQLKQQQDVLDAFGTHFDIWFSEKSLYENDFFKHTQAKLLENGHVFIHEGATWLRTTDFGDD
nr:arginine--tRNA ligase [Actinomycetota bacterium]